MLVEVLHEDGELPVGVPQLAGHHLPLEDQGADLDEVLVALHALVVPEKTVQYYSQSYCITVESQNGIHPSLVTRESDPCAYSFHNDNISNSINNCCWERNFSL